MSQSTKRVGVVTGGGRGIGRGIVHALAPLGFSIVVNYRSDRESAWKTCREAEGLGAARALAIQADVSDLEAGRSLLAQTLAEFGPIDLWVNNAGVAPEVRRDILETTPESWSRVLDTNLRGPFFLTQAIAAAMIEAQARTGTGIGPDPAARPGPQIVFITSISSRFASIRRPEYCVAKAGLSMVAQLFAVRLAEHGIHVYEIRPGLIESDMTQAVHAEYSARIASGLTPIRRWGTPADVGRAVAALAEGSLPFSTGEVIHVDGGLNLRIL